MHTRRLMLLLAALSIFVLVLAAVRTPALATGDAAASAAEEGAAAPAPETADAAEEPGAGSDTLVIAIAEDTASYDPQRAFEMLFPPSSTRPPTRRWSPSRPTRWRRSFPTWPQAGRSRTTGTVYTFTLAEGRTFSDGSPVTAADVVFSFNRLKNLTGNPSFLADGIASVEAPDDMTVVLTLENPDPSILAKMVFDGFSVVNMDVVMENGGTDAEDAATADTAEEFLNQNSAGSGPYVLESWEPGVETVLVRNENYWGDPAPIGRVIFRNIPEAATQKIQLEAGDIDIAFDLSADQVPGMMDNPDVFIYLGLSDTLVFLKGNQDPEIGGPMADPLVQKAVRLALDYEGIRLLAGGESVTPASMLPAGFLGAKDPNTLTRDVEGAKALLAEAGYPDGMDVELAYPDFTFAGVNFGTFAQKIQADLAEVGINATLAPAEVQVALEAYRQGTEPFGLWLWLPDYRDSLDYVEFLPEGVVGLRTNWTNDNADQAILDLRDALKVETDDAVRAGMFGEMQDYLIESGPYAPIIQPGLQIGLNSAIEGFVYNPQWRVDVSLLSK
ncbi:MAG: ABC transporter substrate-binding protein [Caldilineaceae bacterium]